MPTSTYAHMNAVLQYLELTMPGSLLDIGLGNGKMGFLARDLLDVMLGGRYHRRDWTIRIDGIEVFEDYLQAHQRAIYDDIHVGDAFDVIDRLGVYDMVIVGDVLEHFDRERALRFMDKCATRGLAWIILNIPLGERWTQPAIYGNDYERHRSFWSLDEFAPLAERARRYEFPELGDYGSFLIPSATWLRHRAPAIGEAGMGAAIAGLAGAMEGRPPNLAGEMRLAEMLLGAGRLEDARARLATASAAFPDSAEIAAARRQLDAVG